MAELLPCPFCGKHQTLEVITGRELMDEDQEYWTHSDSFAVICSAAKPDGKGGCGAAGGFQATKEAAIASWNTRAPQQREPLTDEQIADLHRDAYTAGKAFTTLEVYTYFARRIEAAHGIGEKK